MTSCSFYVSAFLAFVAIFLTTNICQCDTQVVVETKYGDILGKTRHYPDSESTPFKSVHRFLGVPYALPPLGHLRFRPPKPPSAWKPNILNATQYGKFCAQPRDPGNEKYMQKFLPQVTADLYSEDCLFLNIFTPTTNKMNSEEQSVLPVMFNIHGGGYEVGTSIFAPGDILALRGVVVVAIQYRLSTFGFATTGDSAAPGNYGMLDQVQALRWVKENIGNFGGDSSRVTIFGESAGGSSVCLHMLSPLSRDLVHQSVAMSGVDLSHFALAQSEKVVKYTKMVAEGVGCPTGDSFSMMECLREMNSSAIPLDGFDTWRPVVDGRFLTASPSELRMRCDFLKVPFMSGFTKNEGASFAPPVHPTNNKSQFRDAINKTFKTITNYQSGLPGPKSTQTLILDAIQFQYTPRPFTPKLSVWEQKICDIITDFTFAAPIHKVLSSQTQFAPGYMYIFEHTSRLFNTTLSPSMKHLDDYPYVFGYPLLNLTRYDDIQPAFDDIDRQVSTTMITFLTNFAKYGNPTPSAVRGVRWEKFNDSSRSYLAVGARSQMRSNFEPQNVDFWNTYYPKLLQAPQGHDNTCVVASSISNKTLYSALKMVIAFTFVVFCYD